MGISNVHDEQALCRPSEIPQATPVPLSPLPPLHLQHITQYLLQHAKRGFQKLFLTHPTASNRQIARKENPNRRREHFDEEDDEKGNGSSFTNKSRADQKNLITIIASPLNPPRFLFLFLRPTNSYHAAYRSSFSSFHTKLEVGCRLTIFFNSC